MKSQLVFGAHKGGGSEALWHSGTLADGYVAVEMTKYSLLLSTEAVGMQQLSIGEIAP